MMLQVPGVNRPRLLIFALLLSGLLAGYSPSGAVPPASTGAYNLDDGPYSVGIIDTVILHDPGRNKDLSIKVYYPRTGENFPVIIFSHGAGGSKDTYPGLGSHWASYGYVCIHPTHDDSIALQRQQGANAGILQSVQTAVGDPRAWINRVHDISFVLDSLGQIEHQAPQLRDKMDSNRIGVGGHSFGAYTSMLMGGATITLPGGSNASFRDKRVKGILALSGQGSGQMGLTTHSWDKFTLPMMTMTGSQDRGAGGQGPDWKMEAYQYSPAGDKYHVFIEGANHFSFTGRFARPLNRFTGPLNRSGNNADQKAIFGYVQAASLAFWDTYLKADSRAKNYLASNNLQTCSHGAVKIYHK